MAAIGSNIAKWYVAKLKAHPIVTNLSSAFVLMTTGDLVAQEIETRKRHRQHSAPSTDAEGEDKLSSFITSSQQSNASKGTSPSTSLFPKDTFFNALEGKLSSWDTRRTMTMAAW
eukprot:CAMPEP_0176143808 /NCGR_PEP_ID=MMETSP0120_2-20121206/73201_1 /TAXON_ID=160619 /ORGANISM="Kryptoperidinium foliaceum, Strain CCMP 1326" /LENGTH=114 /DNA_ID=CAMNT_0017480135 /DNA_START=65 /DNA_END=406 /DNA_ORIENTATION=-